VITVSERETAPSRAVFLKGGSTAPPGSVGEPLGDVERDTAETAVGNAHSKWIEALILLLGGGRWQAYDEARGRWHAYDEAKRAFLQKKGWEALL